MSEESCLNSVQSKKEYIYRAQEDIGVFMNTPIYQRYKQNFFTEIDVGRVIEEEEKALDRLRVSLCKARGE